MSTTTIAQQVLAALASRLATIKKDDGFNTNAGKNVFQGRLYLDEDDDLPALSIIENLEQPTMATVDGTLIRETTPYQVQGLISCTPNAPLTAGHGLLADIKKALFIHPSGPEFEMLGGASLSYVGRQVFQRLESARFCEVHVLLEITHGERYGDPYTQN